MFVTSEQIKNWVSKHFKYKVKSRGKQINIHNPFISDNGWHFWISLEKDENKHKKRNYWVHDFRPQYSQFNSSFVRFVQNYKNISYHEALQDICGKSISLKDRLREERDEEKEEEEEIVELVELPKSKGFDEKGSSIAREIAENYLKSRAILSKATKYSLRYTPTSIVCPYIEFGEQVYWQLRDISPKRFEFPNEGKTGLKKTDFVFGFDHVEPLSDIMIVEAIFDAISIDNCAVATGGTGVQNRQARKIRILNPKRIILCPDNDKAGRKALRRDFEFLQGYFDDSSLYFCFPPDGFKDWNEMEQNKLNSSRHFIQDNIKPLTLRSIILASFKDI